MTDKEIAEKLRDVLVRLDKCATETSKKISLSFRDAALLHLSKGVDALANELSDWMLEMEGEEEE